MSYRSAYPTYASSSPVQAMNTTVAALPTQSVGMYSASAGVKTILYDGRTGKNLRPVPEQNQKPSCSSTDRVKTLTDQINSLQAKLIMLKALVPDKRPAEPTSSRPASLISDQGQKGGSATQLPPEELASLISQNPASLISQQLGSVTGPQPIGSMVSQDQPSQAEQTLADTVAEEVHEVHEKVSHFFGMIGALFHSNNSSTANGPAGSTLGKGSTVEVTRPDGIVERGHLVEYTDDDKAYVQLHSYAPGMIHEFPASSISQAMSFAPDVGAGVEAFFNDEWFPGIVLAVPTVSQDPPFYSVFCHGDNPNQRTLVDENSIRPLLSPEEREVVAVHMADLKMKREEAAAIEAAIAAAEAAAAAEKAAAEAEAAAKRKKAEELIAAKASFKETLEAAELGQFVRSFLDNGYDTEASLAFMQDDELQEFGMKPGHVAKFYKAFPRGDKYVVSNANLGSSAPGVPYCNSKSLEDDSFAVAAFGSVVQGTEQLGGWLRVGRMYLPVAVDGKQVLYRQGLEPAAEAPSGPHPSMFGQAESKIKETVAEVAHTVMDTAVAVEAKVCDKLHAFAHMLNFE